MKAIKISSLSNRKDNRGVNYGLPENFLLGEGSIHNIHLATIRPGAIRGNHYHLEGRETVLILYGDSWELAYDNGPGSPVQTNRYEGKGAVAVELQPRTAHAIKNTGKTNVTLVAFSDRIFDPENPDVVQNIITR